VGASRTNNELKIGLVGLDSSHCVEYATLLHQADHAHHVAGARIVAAYPGGSPDWELSASRVDGFTTRMETEFSVPICDSIEAVVSQSDAIMILSVDGRVHLEQFEAVAEAGKPVYIDKPLTIDVAEAQKLKAIAVRTGTRAFSSSVWRFSRGLRSCLDSLNGACRHAALHGQWPLHAGLQGWFFYGIHQVEMLFAAMGPGCLRVACTRDGSSEVLTGFWPDGRMGIISTCHDEQRPFGGCLQGPEGEALVRVVDSKYDRYQAFLQSALAFFRGEAAPVGIDETLETIAFLEAAAQSAEQGGRLVGLSD
jgi:hypothetical protein